MIAVVFIVAAASGAAIRWKAGVRWGKLGTWSLNTAGALALGLLVGLGNSLTTVLGTAGIGAMTTVSGLARELYILGSSSRLNALSYLVATLISGVAAAWVGVHWGFS